MQQHNDNHLQCYECEDSYNVDIVVHTLQGYRVLCLNCATKPEYHQWHWRCYIKNCCLPIVNDNTKCYWYCPYHQQMWNQAILYDD